METLHPAVDLSMPRILPGSRIRSASHSCEQRFGTLWATVNSAAGLAQSMVHEMAHHKLRVLGVAAGSADIVVANGSEDMFPSPVVDFPRPMSAILHAHYALLHVMALDIALLKSVRRTAVVAALSRSYVRHAALLNQSATTIRTHMVVDAFGASFMPTLWAWMERVLEDGRRHDA
jgi:HEXXH motif-containing protein